MSQRRFFDRVRVVRCLVAVVVGAVLFFFMLRWIESRMTFHPDRIGADQKVETPRGASDVWFTTADNVRLQGWYFTARTNPDSAPTILYFHGNGGNITNIDWVGRRFAERDYNILLFDYRGYGRSEGSCFSEIELYADGDAAVAFLIDEKKIDPSRIVLYGQSLGTTVAADLASRKQYGAVILESGLSSASSIARVALPWLPRALHFLGRNRFDSARKLAQVKSPVLITHGDPDEVLPTEEGRKLFAAAMEPKKLIIVPGAGHNVFGSAGESYFKQVEEFILSASPR
jgi:fermentation-respiration switch protein FrsA (DUF1100 family)